MTLEEIWQSIKNWFLSEALWATVFKVFISLVLLFICFKIINSIARKLEKHGDSKRSDKTIMRTIAKLFRIGMKVLVVITLIGFLGIDTSGITALITSFGVCIGLAVNGAVANLAGGVLIIVTRPFRIDDYIEAQGYAGTVEAINITNTKLVTPDNKVIYIPKGPLSNGNIVNYSEKDLRRVDLEFSISYDDNFDKAKEILLSACANNELVLKNPAPFVRMGYHGASSINIKVRVWVNSADYWSVYYDLTETVKREFDANGIEIPYNQLDVHIKKDNE